MAVDLLAVLDMISWRFLSDLRNSLLPFCDPVFLRVRFPNILVSCHGFCISRMQD